MPTQCQNPSADPSSCANTNRRTLRTFLNGIFFADPFDPSHRTYMMPTYNVPGQGYRKQEDAAVAVFKNLGWAVERMNSDDLIKSDGAFHCVTRNVPRLNECTVPFAPCVGECADGPALGKRICKMTT